jgi:hypothetical protein
LDVDWADLELAFRDATGTENYLDLKTGEVVSVVPGFSDEAELREEIAREAHRFWLLTPVDVSFTRAVMEAFVSSLSSGLFQRKLKNAFSRSGGLTRCMELLKDDGPMLAQWHRFEQSRFWRHVMDALREAKVEPYSPPPAVELFEGTSESSG